MYQFYYFLRRILFTVITNSSCPFTFSSSFIILYLISFIAFWVRILIDFLNSVFPSGFHYHASMVHSKEIKFLLSIPHTNNFFCINCQTFFTSFFFGKMPFHILLHTLFCSPYFLYITEICARYFRFSL